MQNRVSYPVIGYPNCDPLWGQTNNPGCYLGEQCIYNYQTMRGTCTKPARANGGVQGKYLELIMLNSDCLFLLHILS